MERIAAFLVDLCERREEAGQLRLPMSRQDIADYLGLTIETVSRVGDKTEARSVIALRDARRSISSSWKLCVRSATDPAVVARSALSPGCSSPPGAVGAGEKAMFVWEISLLNVTDKSPLEISRDWVVARATGRGRDGPLPRTNGGARHHDEPYTPGPCVEKSQIGGSQAVSSL